MLFIDEAYYLYRPENERDYGQEAIEMLLQVMEAERDRLVVVLAGYRDRMETFFRSNPGMGSRIAHHIDFPDYTVEELIAIAGLMLERRAYRLSAAAREAFREYVERRDRAAALRERPQHPQRDRPGAAAPGRPAVRARPRALTRDDLITIEAAGHPAQLGVSQRVKGAWHRDAVPGTGIQTLRHPCPLALDQHPAQQLARGGLGDLVDQLDSARTRSCGATRSADERHQLLAADRGARDDERLRDLARLLVGDRDHARVARPPGG